MLDSKLQKYKAAGAGSSMVDKVVHLETELAEALEANNMYKLQLRRYVLVCYALVCSAFGPFIA